MPRKRPNISKDVYRSHHFCFDICQAHCRLFLRRTERESLVHSTGVCAWWVLIWILLGLVWIKFMIRCWSCVPKDNTFTVATPHTARIRSIAAGNLERLLVSLDVTISMPASPKEITTPFTSEVHSLFFPHWTQRDAIVNHPMLDDNTNAQRRMVTLACCRHETFQKEDDHNRISNTIKQRDTEYLIIYRWGLTLSSQSSGTRLQI